MVTFIECPQFGDMRYYVRFAHGINYLSFVFAIINARLSIDAFSEQMDEAFNKVLEYFPSSTGMFVSCLPTSHMLNQAFVSLEDPAED